MPYLKAMREAWRKFVAGENGQPVLYQRPNAPLFAWVVLEALSLIIRANLWHSLFSWLALVAIIIWALMETFRGASYFRRMLGFAVLCWVVIGRLW
jgi:hypothetical protein